jgi:hypothetical protein
VLDREWSRHRVLYPTRPALLRNWRRISPLLRIHALRSWNTRRAGTGRNLSNSLHRARDEDHMWDTPRGSRGIAPPLLRPRPLMRRHPPPRRYSPQPGQARPVATRPRLHSCSGPGAWHSLHPTTCPSRDRIRPREVCQLRFAVRRHGRLIPECRDYLPDLEANPGRQATTRRPAAQSPEVFPR